ncbi:MAG: Abi family protein [Ruminococcus sp.]|nr:Abi family protein [Ruminococcus sp.]
MQPKSTDQLMEYMNKEKGIFIDSQKQKNELRYIGYFHGYKGYRYCNNPASLLPYNNFSQLKAVYDFDMRLKSILYPQIMFLETAIKNYALENIISEINSSLFDDVYTKLLNDYKAYQVGSAEYKRAFLDRMNVRNKIFSIISRDYGHNNIVNHYYDKDRPMPIWAVFELLSLGEFGKFFSCLNNTTRIKISHSIGIKSSVDSDGKMVEKIVYTLKDLRNAVAHNNAVFDTRFRTGSVSGRISNYISSEINIKTIRFDSIVDYIILISFLMKILNCDKSIISGFISQFEKANETLRLAVPTKIHSKIIYTDTKNKIEQIINFL